MLDHRLVVPLPVGHHRDGHRGPDPKLQRQRAPPIEHPLHQMASLAVVAPVEPEGPQRPTQRARRSRIARGERPRHGGPEVVVLLIDALHPRHLTGAPQLRMRLLRQRREQRRRAESRTSRDLCALVPAAPGRTAGSARASCSGTRSPPSPFRRPPTIDPPAWRAGPEPPRRGYLPRPRPSLPPPASSPPRIPRAARTALCSASLKSS